MNTKGQGQFAIGMAILVAAFIFLLALFSTIDPLKENLDTIRGNSALNCPGTPDFNQSSFDDDTDLQKLGRRSTCFVTGITMVWLVGSFLIGLVIWVFKNWTGIK